ncbi:MAG TPA: hypothetical protein VKH81_03840 [Candidatus Angelobacter sp.]|nr:hypothetical protein [Candidatus Angelobacter sp.]
MLCVVTGRSYVELNVAAPRAYNGWMRLYVDRIDQVVDLNQAECVVVWRRTARLVDDDTIGLTVRLNGPAVRQMLRFCGWRERKPGEPAGLLQ